MMIKGAAYLQNSLKEIFRACSFSIIMRILVFENSENPKCSGPSTIWNFEILRIYKAKSVFSFCLDLKFLY